MDSPCCPPSDRSPMMNDGCSLRGMPEPPWRTGEGGNAGHMPQRVCRKGESAHCGSSFAAGSSKGFLPGKKSLQFSAVGGKAFSMSTAADVAEEGAAVSGV